MLNLCLTVYIKFEVLYTRFDCHPTFYLTYINYNVNGSCICIYVKEMKIKNINLEGLLYSCRLYKVNSRNTDERSNALVVHASDVLQPLSLEFAVLAFRTIKFVHSSLPFEHLGQSSLCENQVFFYFRTETMSQVPGVLKIYSAFIFK